MKKYLLSVAAGAATAGLIYLAQQQPTGKVVYVEWDDSNTGTVNTLEYKNTLTQTNWQTYLVTNQVGTNHHFRVPVVVTNPQQFYRVGVRW